MEKRSCIYHLKHGHDNHLWTLIWQASPKLNAFTLRCTTLKEDRRQWFSVVLTKRWNLSYQRAENRLCLCDVPQQLKLISQANLFHAQGHSLQLFGFLKQCEWGTKNSNEKNLLYWTHDGIFSVFTNQKSNDYLRENTDSRTPAIQAEPPLPASKQFRPYQPKAILLRFCPPGGFWVH